MYTMFRSLAFFLMCSAAASNVTQSQARITERQYFICQAGYNLINQEAYSVENYQHVEDLFCQSYLNHICDTYGSMHRKCQVLLSGSFSIALWKNKLHLVSLN